METYILGVSGGPDSMALLDMAVRHQLPCVVCHVDYHVRDDSSLDAKLVKAYCERYHIPLEVLDVKHYQAGNFEHQARQYRYQFYLRTAEKYHATAVLLAHHKDDFLESVLMIQARKMEDVYLGIRASSCYEGLKIIRPFMSMYKKDLVEYCDKHHVPYRIDKTNLTNEYTRNYYRNEVLSHYTRDQKEALYEEAMAYNEALERKEQAVLHYLEGKECLSVIDLLSQADPLYTLRLFLNRYISHQQMSKRMLEGVLETLKNHPGNIRIVLSIHFLLIKEYDNVYVTQNEQCVSYYFEIDEPCEKDYGVFTLAFEGDDREGITPKTTDYPLIIRPYQPGDKISLSYGTKKLSRLFIDAKIPKSQREVWPVVLNCHQEILLVPKIAKNKAYLLPNPTLFVIQ